MKDLAKTVVVSAIVTTVIMIGGNVGRNVTVDKLERRVAKLERFAKEAVDVINSHSNLLGIMHKGGYSL